MLDGLPCADFQASGLWICVSSSICTCTYTNSFPMGADFRTDAVATRLSPGNSWNRKHPLQQIEENIALRKRLEQLEKEEGIVRQRAANKEVRRSNTQNEIYQLFGLYFVFQGVLLSALFQGAGGGSELCHLWWLPFSLSLITSGAAIAATFHKLHDHGRIEYALELEKEDARAIFKLIQELLHKGDEFDIDKGPQNKAKTGGEPSIFACIFHRNLRRYTIFVTFVLTLFSGILLTACKLVLCSG